MGFIVFRKWAGYVLYVSIAFVVLYEDCRKIQLPMKTQIIVLRKV